MKARTLNIGEIVCIIIDGEGFIGKGEIISINGETKSKHFSGDELNENVEIKITEIGVFNSENQIGDVVNVDNQFVYQIAPNKSYCGHLVCYEHNIEESDYDYYCPALDDGIDESELTDETQQEGEVEMPTFRNGYEYVQYKIRTGRWDLDSDTFDIETALADAWDDGYASK